jgi:hypothetical protein
MEGQSLKHSRTLGFAYLALLFLIGLALQGCHGQAVKMNGLARNAEKAVTTNYLTLLANESSGDAPAVKDVLDNWDRRTDDQNFDAAHPLLVKYMDGHFEEAAAIDVLLRNWQSRLMRQRDPHGVLNPNGVK